MRFLETGNPGNLYIAPSLQTPALALLHAPPEAIASHPPKQLRPHSPLPTRISFFFLPGPLVRLCLLFASADKCHLIRCAASGCNSNSTSDRLASSAADRRLIDAARQLRMQSPYFSVSRLQQRDLALDNSIFREQQLGQLLVFRFNDGIS